MQKAKPEKDELDGSRGPHSPSIELTSIEEPVCILVCDFNWLKFLPNVPS